MKLIIAIYALVAIMGGLVVWQYQQLHKDVSAVLTIPTMVLEARDSEIKPLVSDSQAAEGSFNLQPAVDAVRLPQDAQIEVWTSTIGNY